MKKILVIIILAFTLHPSIYAKGIKLQLQSGVGTYSMSDMKSFDLFMISQIPLPLQETRNFPAYWYYQGALLFEINDHLSLGPMYAFHSTGSRHSLADYSGQYYFDDMIHSHSIGLTTEYLRQTSNNLKLGAYLDTGISFSKATFKQYLELTEIEGNSSFKNNASETGYFVEPGFRVAYPIRFIEPGFHIGYYFPVYSNGFKENEEDQSLYLSNGDKLKSGWNGIRIGLSLTIRLNKKD